MFVCLSLILNMPFFPLAAKLIGPRTGCQFFFKNVDFFSVECPLNSVCYLMEIQSLTLKRRGYWKLYTHVSGL